MKLTAAYTAPKATFWTRRKKLLLLFLVLFVTFSYHYMSYGDGRVWWYARLSAPGAPYPFSFVDFISGIWSERVDAEFWGYYFLAMTPFLLLYPFWWRKPTVGRFLAPGLYLLIFVGAYFYHLHTLTAFNWPQLMAPFPEYIAEIPAWLRFLYL